MPSFLICHLGQRVPWCVSVDGDRVSIGSAKSASVTIPVPQLAAEEAEITRVGGKARLRDASGRGQVFLNGSRVSDAPIADGDRVRLGDMLLVFSEATELNRQDLDRMEQKLAREISSPEGVNEALRLQSINRTLRVSWRETTAIALAGLALGVGLAVLAWVIS